MKLSDTDALFWLDLWDRNNSPPKGTDRLREIIANAHSYGRNEYGAAGGDESPPGGRFSANGKAPVPHDDDRSHLTDRGNAQRVVDQQGEDLRYCWPWKSWLAWDGRRWATDQTGEIVRRVKDVQANLFRRGAAQIAAAQSIADKAERKARVSAAGKLVSHCLAWESAKLTAASIDLARSESGIPILPDDLDKDDWLLNVENGTLDLRTGGLRSHAKADLITKLAPVRYDPAATCPIWERFVKRIMDGNNPLIRYLQRVSGYALTGEVIEQCLFFLHGEGANGKSTFLASLRELLGDYAVQAVSELLMAKNNEAHPTERADLFGARFVATVETDEGKRMAESLMKQLTGGDPLKARKMRQDFFELRPTWKIFLAANHKPKIRGGDHAVWRRIKLIPFVVTIPDDEQDKRLPSKLREERSGILNWMLAGLRDWQQGGLQEPEEVKAATAVYRQEQDRIAQFIHDVCIVKDGEREKATDLFNAYRDWASDKWTTQTAFGRELTKRGFEKEKDGVIYYVGLRLAEPISGRFG